MEGVDILLNLDWDPVYLQFIFDQDFYDMSELWNGDLVTDSDLVKVSEIVEKEVKYVPVVEEIYIEDEILRDAVDRIESE